MSKSWDSGILKKLKSLVGKGLSTSEIGKKLGISKNAVVGKLHRMGWNSGAAETLVAKKASAKSATKAVAKNDKKNAKTTKVVTKKTSAKPVDKKAVTKKVATPAKTKVVAKDKADKEEKKPAVQKTTKSADNTKKNLNVHQRIIQHSLEMMDLKPGQCRWPIGDPDSENFHFCGRSVFVGKPYCYEHCKQAYQFNAPKKKQ